MTCVYDHEHGDGADCEYEIPYWECPYYRYYAGRTAEKGTCTFGCQQEPVCVTSSYDGYWPGDPDYPTEEPGR